MKCKCEEPLQELSDSRVGVSGLKMYLICTPTPSQYTSEHQSDYVETFLLGESYSPMWLLTLLREVPCFLHCLSQASLSLSLKRVLGKLCLQNAPGTPLCNINISALDTKYDLQMKIFQDGAIIWGRIILTSACGFESPVSEALFDAELVPSLYNYSDWL